jgi:hypothetical protein
MGFVRVASFVLDVLDVLVPLWSFSSLASLFLLSFLSVLLLVVTVRDPSLSLVAHVDALSPLFSFSFSLPATLAYILARFAFAALRLYTHFLIYPTTLSIARYPCLNDTFPLLAPLLRVRILV